MSTFVDTRNPKDIHEAYEHALHVEERLQYGDKARDKSAYDYHVSCYAETTSNRARSPSPYSRLMEGTSRTREQVKSHELGDGTPNPRYPLQQYPPYSPHHPVYPQQYPPLYPYPSPFVPNFNYPFQFPFPPISAYIPTTQGNMVDNSWSNLHRKIQYGPCHLNRHL